MTGRDTEVGRSGTDRSSTAHRSRPAAPAHGALSTRPTPRPGPLDDEVSAATYARHFDAAFGRRFAERALDALAVVRGSRVLDVACGTGIFARMAAHVAGPSGTVVGVDPSPAALEAARHIDVTSTVEWERWDDERLPFPDASFDVVSCQHALHRFGDPPALLREMRRVLTPGGCVGVTTWGPIEENPAFAAELDAAVKSGLDTSGVVELLVDAFAYHRAEDLRAMAQRAALGEVSVRSVRMLSALPRVSEWVRVYATVPPLSVAWRQCDQQARIQFLSRATELLRPFEHDGVLRVQASSRLLVARTSAH